jgi:protein SCO1/2
MKTPNTFLHLVALALPLAFASSCKPEVEGNAPPSLANPEVATEQGEASCCAEEAPAALGALPDASIYNLESQWTDQAGTIHALSDFRGKVTVAAMIFTHCKFACPRILVDLKAIEKEIPEDRLGEVRWLLFSMDSDRDLPEVLKAYAAANDLDTKRWTLMHGDDSAVREMGATLGVRYIKDAEGNFSHSNLITVLDQDGRISHQLEGLGAENSPSVAAILGHLE